MGSSSIRAGTARIEQLRSLEFRGRPENTVALNYVGGLRYFALERDSSKPHLLAEIVKPLADKPQ